jgi:hypothetical protein
MPELLTTGCMLSCSFGVAPSAFIATEMPGKPTLNEVLLAATIFDIIPVDNIPPFGMCSSEANPEVAAATAAALGVLTPMPCVPVIVDPWAPPSAILMANEMPLATVESKCECAWGGVISVAAPAEFTTTTDA